jgi:hypothetical protein
MLLLRRSHPSLFATLWALSLGGCSNSYSPPTADQPHALVKFERRYEGVTGRYLDEELDVMDQEAFSLESEVSRLGLARIDEVLIHPHATQLTAMSSFFHYETRLVQEAYYGSFSGGSSYQSIPSYRWVYRTVRVTDAGCADSVWLSPAEGATYRVRLEMTNAFSCQLTCETEQADGGDPLPCPPPTLQEKLDADKTR